ncbi:uroporphyrinogen-III C-methyltransferase [Photobacterium sp. DA100]|uniref:uroporphyrinogen-III C-methyltransferase n=1 Tax=Photobacterium sp. DA100 TaxID=3027472 RepID=UPI00247964C0|nr:uroporphyrinogen-III C-methyltransferase [Photobacterium sp. DA100]WEM44027.1 uroporphyrinogen-III C-methyltransferase [Photobacterium sp. DA100]
MREQAGNALISASVASGRKVGKVDLVGAGPGDPMLLTLRAMQSIEQADVIVYDRLVSKQIRACFPASAQALYVGKAKGEHSTRQEAINNLLVALAWQGKSVCRLKGGDAFIFGRGSEEMLALKAAGVPVDVVPGITAAAGCTSYAGIPLTHRGVSQGCTFVTGHAEQSLDLNWPALAQLDHTLVFYMGVTKSTMIRDRLLACGAKPTTPVALVEKGCCPEQRTVTGQLQHLPALVTRHQVVSPALIVVGEVVALAEQLQWVSQIAELQQQKQLQLSA